MVTFNIAQLFVLLSNNAAHYYFLFIYLLQSFVILWQIITLKSSVISVFYIYFYSSYFESVCIFYILKF